MIRLNDGVVTCCHAAMLTRWLVDSSSVHPVKEENVNQSWDGGAACVQKRTRHNRVLYIHKK